jgi:hypothetical protein
MRPKSSAGLAVNCSQEDNLRQGKSNSRQENVTIRCLLIFNQRSTTNPSSLHSQSDVLLWKYGLCVCENSNFIPNTTKFSLTKFASTRVQSRVLVCFREKAAWSWPGMRVRWARLSFSGMMRGSSPGKSPEMQENFNRT